jgi:hypothetical protein
MKVSPYMKNEIAAPITEMPLLYPEEDLLLVITGNLLAGYDTNHPPVNGGMGRRWHVELTGTPKGLMIADGVVYCVLGNELHAYHLVDGKPIWPKVFTGQGSAALLPPVASSDYLYLLDEQGAQYKVRKLSGLADASWGGVIKKGTVKFPPLPIGRTLYYNVEQYMVGVDMLSGKEVWLLDLTDGVFTGGWSGPSQVYLVSPPVMNDRNSFFVLVHGEHPANGFTGNFIVGVETDLDQPGNNKVTYFKRDASSYLYQQELSFQSDSVGDNIGFFVRNIQQPLVNWDYSQMSPYAWIVYPYTSDSVNNAVKGISYIDGYTGFPPSYEFMEFATRHKQDPIFCSFLGDTTHALFAAGTELQPAEVAESDGARYYQWSREGYDVGLQMTAPPVFVQDGTLYATGRDPSDGKYYLARFRDISLTTP